MPIIKAKYRTRACDSRLQYDKLRNKHGSTVVVKSKITGEVVGDRDAQGNPRYPKRDKLREQIRVLESQGQTITLTPEMSDILAGWIDRPWEKSNYGIVGHQFARSIH